MVRLTQEGDDVPTRIVLIDDNENDLLFTHISLQRCGVECEVFKFERAEEALKWLTSEPSHDIDLVLLDINMPGMGGFDFLDAFEPIPIAQRGESIVVLLTSSSDPVDRERASRYASVKGFLNKPLDRTVAASLIDLLGHP